MSFREEYRAVVNEARETLAAELPEQCIDCPIRGQRFGPYVVAQAFRNGDITREQVAAAAKNLADSTRKDCQEGVSTRGGDFPHPHCNFGVWH